MKKTLLTSLLITGAISTLTQAAVVLDGTSSWPTTSSFQTTTTDNSERDTGVNRDAGQTFQISESFTLDAIFIEYQASNPYGDGNMTIRIYQIASGTQNASNTAPTPIGSDLLNVTFALNSTTRAAANFTTSTTETSVLKFDLTGSDEVFIPEGTYALMFEEDMAGRAFTWRSNNANGYSGGRQFDNLANLGSQLDGKLALTAVPEPGAALLGGLGLLALLRRRRAA
jgi:hypothetical protein